MMQVELPLVIDTSIKEQLLNFVYTAEPNMWVNNTTGNTFNRKFCALNTHKTSFTRVIYEYSQYIYSLFNITQQQEENKFGNFIGYHTEGGFVHLHTDHQNSIGWEHVRINFLVCKPLLGGNPVIENKEYLIKEDYAWFNLASKWVHSSTPVVGGRPRIVLSLGAYVSPRELNEAKIH